MAAHKAKRPILTIRDCEQCTRYRSDGIFLDCTKTACPSFKIGFFKTPVYGFSSEAWECEARENSRSSQCFHSRFDHCRVLELVKKIRAVQSSIFQLSL